ncbi:uncharacterized protein [Struthio camelus]|uniref:uncharacterized protein isoform X5 n=1 Tax=Struthio camelus TaxID=8801 RepID=UPI003603C2D3
MAPTGGCRDSRHYYYGIKFALAAYATLFSFFWILLALFVAELLLILAEIIFENKMNAVLHSSIREGIRHYYDDLDFKNILDFVQEKFNALLPEKGSLGSEQDVTQSALNLCPRRQTSPPPPSASPSLGCPAGAVSTRDRFGAPIFISFYSFCPGRCNSGPPPRRLRASSLQMHAEVPSETFSGAANLLEKTEIFPGRFPYLQRRGVPFAYSPPTLFFFLNNVFLSASPLELVFKAFAGEMLIPNLSPRPRAKTKDGKLRRCDCSPRALNPS